MVLQDNNNRTNDRINDSRNTKISRGVFDKLHLKDLTVLSRKDNSCFVGTIESVIPFDDKTSMFKLQLVQDSTKLMVQIKGNFISEFSKKFKSGLKLCFLGKFGTVKTVSKVGEFNTFRIEYENGVEGFLFDEEGEEGDKEYFEFQPLPVAKPKKQTVQMLASSGSSSVAADEMDGVEMDVAQQEEEAENYVQYKQAERQFDNGHEPEVESGSEFESEFNSESLTIQAEPTQPVKPAQSQSDKMQVDNDNNSSSIPNPKKRGMVNPPNQGARSKKAAKTARPTRNRKHWGLTVSPRVMNDPVTKKDYTRPARTYLQVEDLHFIGRDYKVIAIANPKGPATLTKTGDWMLTLYLNDPSVVTTRRFVNLFATSANRLPVVEAGDVVCLANIQFVKGSLTLTGYKGFEFCVFKANELESGKMSSTMRNDKIFYGPEEIEYAKDLQAWYLGHNGGLPELSTAAPKIFIDAKTKSAQIVANNKGSSARKLLEIKDLVGEHGAFVDVIAEIIDFYKPRDRDDILDLYISDYTVHEQLFDYSKSQTHWKGPTGQLTLKCAIARPFPNKNLLVEPGAIVKISNLKVSIENSFLKGGTWIDNDYPDKVAVVLSNASDEFKARRAAYWLQHNKTRKDDEAKSQAELAIELAKPPIVVEFKSENEPLVSIKAVLQDTDKNRIHHLRGIVVSFGPQALNDWVKAICPECKEPIPDAATSCLEHNKVELFLEFKLQIQDTSKIDGEESITVKVTQSNFQKFLPDLKLTSDMRGLDPNISVLRKQITPLLGSLESLMKAGAKEAEDDHLGLTFDFAVTQDPNRRKSSWAFFKTSIKNV